jgi:hypothetical protein
MSFVSGTQAELIWSGPSASYTAQAAASSSAQFLMPGASGAFEQPFIPANFWQMGRRNQRARIDMAGVLNSTGGTTTTIIFTLGLATSPNTATPGAGGGNLVATTAMTVTSFAANSAWRLSAEVLGRNVGYGTSSISTSLLTDAEVKCVNSGATTLIGGMGAPVLLSTIDCSAQWWLYALATFSTAATTNSCQLTRCDIWGLN